MRISVEMFGGKAIGYELIKGCGGIGDGSGG